MIRKDGLTSSERKEKYSEEGLEKLAMEAYKYFQKNGWEPLTVDNMKRLRNGTEIRCCQSSCGCFGQIEKIRFGEKIQEDVEGEYRDVYHTRHEEEFGTANVDRSYFTLGIKFGLIRKRK